MSAIATLRRWRHGPMKALNPVWTVLGRAYRVAARAGLSPPVEQRIGPYGPFRLQPEFAFSNFENWGGAHNSGFRACIEACRGADCVFDVGGHIGLVTLPMSRVMAEGGQVYTFEPAAANLRCLRRHIADNGITNVEVIESLVGQTDRDDVVFFEEPGASGMNGLAVKRGEERFSQTTHRQISLDSFCKRHGLSPKIIKIDVEGAETLVLEGATEVLRRCRPKIFLSIHPAHLKLLGSSAEALLALIDQNGYECREIDGSPMKSVRLDEYLVVPKDTGTSC
jgi:FkbM family methyltransferase